MARQPSMLFSLSFDITGKLLNSVSRKVKINNLHFLFTKFDCFLLYSTLEICEVNHVHAGADFYLFYYEAALKLINNCF